MKTIQLLVRVRIDDDERSDLDILRDMSGFLKEAVRKNVRQLDDRDPLELAFAREWLKENENQDILARLLSPTNEPQETTMTERDALVAATVIQWLGSHVGQGFVRRVQE